ncbi:MAG: amidohydrolase [Gammaproteobacteria bacterium]|nr:amidohydrolase [Gammaproteobacteria bacterium]
MNWKTAILIVLALVAGLGVLFQIATRTPPAPEHQVFINGTVLTMDASNRIAQALSARGDRIEAVGTTDDIMSLVDDTTLVFDLKGRTLLPGFIDAHGHFPGSGMMSVNADLNSPPIGTHTTIPQVLDALRELARQREPGEFVVGWGYDDTLLEEQRHPTRAELDSVSSEHPVVAIHVSGHMVVANSAALELVGITAATPDPPGGVIGRQAGSAEPNGLLEENARMDLLLKAQDMPLLDVFRMVKAAAQDYSARGVTTAQSGGVDQQLASGLALFSKLGMVHQRLVIFPAEIAFYDALLSGDFDAGKYTTDKLLVGPVKLIADGSIQGYTGYLSRPYYTPYKGDAEYAGYPTISRDALFEKVAALHAAGYQMAIHGNGDQSIEDILDAFEAAQRQRPVVDPRLIIIHAQMAREDQIQRMQALGVTPSFFSAHTWYWGDRHRDIFMGPQRAATISPAAWALQYGVRFTSHLDTPVVPMEPLQAVWSQVHRITYGGDVLGPQQSIGVMQALRSVTIDAAWQIFQEDNRGSLEPGKYADLVVLSGNPLEDPINMRALKVDRTIVGGATIYQRR